MAQQPTLRKIVKPKEPKPDKVFIPEKYQDYFYISLLIVSVWIFLWGAISGGGFNVDDNIASVSFRTYLDEANKSGEFPLWIPYIFGGMPSYAALLTTGARSWDILATLFFGITKFVGDVFGSDVARVSAFYIIYAIGMYMFMRFKKQDRFVAFITAFAAVFSTQIITWVMIGHNTKPIVLAMFPYIFLLLEKLRERFSLLYAALLAVVVHLMFEGGHLQMIFYFGCAVALYFVFELISRFRQKGEALKVVRTALILLVAGGIAFLISSDRYLSTMEYTDYSTRGSAPIEKTAAQKQDAKGGNDYEYATMWSFSFGETFNFFVPSYFGHGVRDLSSMVKQGSKDEKVMAPTYWGQKESEDSPPYMGILVIGLGILGIIIYRKDPFVQFLFVLVLFGLLLSFGKNGSFLYKLFFDTIPSFNKFRAPSMSLVLVNFAFPILAGYCLSAFLNWKNELTDKRKQIITISVIASACFLVLAFIFTAVFKGAYIDAVKGSPKIGRMLQYVSDLPNYIFSSMITDWYFSAIFLIVTFVAVLYFVKGKLPKAALFGIIALIMVVDLWRVDYRRMEVSKESWDKEIFEPYSQLYKPIKEDKSVFRICDLVSEHPNIPAYYLLENVNGYHSAKMRVYQDILDVANSDENAGSTSTLYNPFLWNLMNVKYIITFDRTAEGKKSNQPVVVPNPEVLPRAFFVKRAEVAQGIDILKKLKKGDFDPKEVAFVEKAISAAIDTTDSTAVAEVIEHKNHSLKIKANATGNNLLFISEIYYPVSWKAYIDGKETEIFKTNYAFRSVIVPKGEHTIEFKFVSEKFEQGRTISTASTVLIFLMLAVGGYFEYRRISLTKKNQESENSNEE